MLSQRVYTYWDIDECNNLVVYNKYGEIITCLSMWEILTALGYTQG
jgi:hypothetical protein